MVMAAAMRKMIPSGIWEIFIPHVKEGAHYKIEVRGPHGDVMLKTDPFALFAQHGTQTGCMVFKLSSPPPRSTSDTKRLDRS